MNKLFPDIHLEQLKGMRGPEGTSLWLESFLWECEGLNCSVTLANSGMLSPHEVFYQGLPPMPVLPFCKPAYHRVSRRRDTDPQTRPCFFLGFGYNHGRDFLKVTDVEMGVGMVVYSRDVTWHQPWEPLVSPAPTVGARPSNPPCGTKIPE